MRFGPQVFQNNWTTAAKIGHPAIRQSHSAFKLSHPATKLGHPVISQSDNAAKFGHPAAQIDHPAIRQSHSAF